MHELVPELRHQNRQSLAVGGGSTLQVPSQLFWDWPHIRKYCICHDLLRDRSAKESSELIRFICCEVEAERSFETDYRLEKSEAREFVIIARKRHELSRQPKEVQTLVVQVTLLFQPSCLRLKEDVSHAKI